MISRQQIGQWLRSGWAGMTILGLSVLVRGLCYLPTVVPPGHRIPALESVFPLSVWTAVWISVGVGTLVCAALKKAQPMMVGACVALHALWAFLYVGDWLIGDSRRGYITGLSYLTIALLTIWAFFRGESSEVRVRLDERR